ncbi:unnamed protein product [Fusarium equiseti]|uniref:Uncharacterized protein n=1 Tax=Fusarium equiseti TaxID=61235 RepID=A0A8J2IXS0_FUSEQ|nr:unnamed protein product [Fusarium equiseti]
MSHIRIDISNEADVTFCELSSPAAAGAGTASAAIEEVSEKPNGNEDNNILVDAGIPIDDVKDIGKHMDEIAKANAAVDSASRALTESMSSLAIAGDTRTAIDGLQRQLNAAKKDFSELQQTYTIAASIKTSGSPTGKVEDIVNLPSSNGGSRWNEVHVKSTGSNDCTKPGSEAGLQLRTLDDWKTGSKIEDVVKAITDSDQEKKPEGYLVAFHVGYILVKDCVIKVNSDDKSMQEFVDKQSKSSEGFLCFSSRLSLDSSSSSIISASNVVVIRIPGPQILGYIMQLISEDKSQEFSEVPTQDLFPEDSEDSDPRLDVQSTRTPRQKRTDFSTWRPSGPANGVQEPTPGAISQKPGHIVDALRKALDSDDFADWAKQQPESVKEEILAKVMEAFGKTADRKQG